MYEIKSSTFLLHMSTFVECIFARTYKKGRYLADNNGLGFAERGLFTINIF